MKLAAFLRPAQDEDADMIQPTATFGGDLPPSKNLQRHSQEKSPSKHNASEKTYKSEQKTSA